MVYGVTSFLYRWTVVIAILWFCNRWLEPYGLKAAAQLLTAIVIAGTVVLPAGRAAAMLLDPARGVREYTSARQSSAAACCWLCWPRGC